MALSPFARTAGFRRDGIVDAGAARGVLVGPKRSFALGVPAGVLTRPAPYEKPANTV
jgi:hypothetical protein